MQNELVNKILGTTIASDIYHTISWVLSPSKDLQYCNPRHVQNSDDAIAIYCVHGTADRVSSFKDLAEALHDKLPGKISSINIVAFDHRGMGEGIETFAKQLDKKIRLNGDKNVILIGHSRGGLVSAYYTEYLAKYAHVYVPAVIAIGAPFEGSHAALFPLALISKSVREMQIQSGFLKILNNKIARTISRYICFSGTEDGLVSNQAAHPTLKYDSLTIQKGDGHLSILHSDDLAMSIQDSLMKLCDSFEPDDMKSIDLASSIQDACDDIDMEIELLKIRTHLFSSFSKQRVLLKLRELLNDVMTGKNNAYPSAKTVSDFICEFLKDRHLFNGNMPKDILAQSLNFPLNWLLGSITESTDFINNLIAKNRDVQFAAALQGSVNMQESLPKAAIMGSLSQ